MAKKKAAPKKKTVTKKPQFAHGDIVRFNWQQMDVDGIVAGYDGELYFVRLIGEFYHLHPGGLLQLVADELTIATLNPREVKSSELPRLWDRIAAQRLMGRTIVNAVYAASEEGNAELTLELDDGSLIWPMRDDEGNGPGSLHGVGPEGADGTEGEIFILPTL